MRRLAKITTLMCVCVWLAATAAFAQQPADSSNTQQQSLGDYARALRAKHQPSVEVTQRDAGELFKSVNEILAFASQNSGYPKRANVKYQLIGRQDADRHLNQGLMDGQKVHHLVRAELVMKQFGLLPQDFDLKQKLMQTGASGLAGYYDFKTKTMNLLNWIDLDQQRSVMAHELTHALQDQNYDLKTFNTMGESLTPQPTMSVDEKQTRESEARIAVVEGQATVVQLDYLLQPWGRSLGDSPEALDRVKNRVMGRYDSPVVVHNAPLVLKETTLFPYVDGLAFEIELLKSGGKKLAFAGAFARPPRDTHDIMEPDSYLARKRPAPLIIPDLSGALGNGYQPYDSGLVGELDVRIMAELFGRENDPYLIAPNWDGGAYVAVKKPAAADKAETQLSPADLGLIYFSRWKSAQAVQRFAELYKNALAKRSQVLGEEPMKPVSCPERPAGCSPVWAAHLNTDQGPVVMEIWPGNMLLIAQGLDVPAINQVRTSLLHPRANTKRASLDQHELSLQLLQFPQVQALQQNVLRQVAHSLAAEMLRGR